MAYDFWKVVYFQLVGLVSRLFVFLFENLAHTLSPATLGHHRLCCCLCCCGAAVLLVWCSCGAAVVVLMVVVLLLSRLCEDETLSRTQQSRCVAVCFCDSLLRVMGDVYSRQVSYQFGLLFTKICVFINIMVFPRPAGEGGGGGN